MTNPRYTWRLTAKCLALLLSSVDFKAKFCYNLFSWGCIVSTGWHIKNCKPNMILRCVVLESKLNAEGKTDALFANRFGFGQLALAA